MIFDKLAEFADAATASASASATANVGSTMDLTNVRDIGQGRPLYVVIQIDTDLTGASATIEFLLVSDSTATPSVDGTQSVHQVSGRYTATALDAGEQLALMVPPGGVGGTFDTYERYLGVQVRETSGNALSGGKINAFLTLDPPPSAAKVAGFADAQN